MASSTYAHVADIYDRYVQVEFDIDYWLNVAAQFPGEILELMCGTGRVTVPLLEAGYRVTALDNSPEMLAELRKKLERKTASASIQKADARNFNLGKQFDLIILPFNAFAEILSRDDRFQALKTIHCHLSDNGRFICTLHNPPVRLKSVDGQLHLVNKFPLDDGNLLFWILQQHHPDTKSVQVFQFYEEYDTQDILRKKRMLNMSFSLIDKSEFEGLAEKSGFHVVHLYGDYANSPFEETISPFMIWVLEKDMRDKT